MVRAGALFRAAIPAEATRLIRDALARQSALDPKVDPLVEPSRKPAARTARAARLTQARIDTEHGSRSYRRAFRPVRRRGR